MEAILTDCVRNSLQQLMYRNAIFMCERLCAEFPTEKNLQLLASCYLQNNQAHCAYHILKGTHIAECRYLFALACFQMDLLNEAESVLSPNESSAEVPNGAAGHFLLGLVYRYTDRKQMAINHFNQALSMDPLLWAAYEELCILGAAEEATFVFDDGASIFIQKQYLQRGLASRSLQKYLGTLMEQLPISPRMVVPPPCHFTTHLPQWLRNHSYLVLLHLQYAGMHYLMVQA